MRPSSDSLSAALEQLRARQAPRCTTCPRRCNVTRTRGHLGVCRAPQYLLVAQAAPHFGEEAVLVGTGGSGTVFFCGCNLQCAFCQNSELSHDMRGSRWDVSDLVYAMLRLADGGCENVNFVTPTHYAAQVAEAVIAARQRGLRVPIVYNCGGYESVDTLRLLEGLVDIYMPDLKFHEAETARVYCAAADYPLRARQAVREMHRQVGDLKIDAEVAKRGLLVRHLVMPGGADEGKAILDWLADEVSPRTYVNVMGQYRPMHRAADHAAIDHRPTGDEVIEVRAHAQRLGLRLAE